MPFRRGRDDPRIREAFPEAPHPPLEPAPRVRGRHEAYPPAPPPVELEDVFDPDFDQVLRGPGPGEPPRIHPPVTDLAGLADQICRCICATTKQLLDELPGKVATAVEQQLITSRGMPVAAPPTCSQPVGGTDVDDQVLKHPIPASSPVGTRIVVLKRTVVRATVLKGLNWQWSVDGTNNTPQDPANQVAVSVLVDDRFVGNSIQGQDLPTAGLRTGGAYQQQRIAPAPGGIGALGACQIYIPAGGTVVLVAERVTPPSGQTAVDYNISARWKGWDWTATIDAPGVTGVGGY